MNGHRSQVVYVLKVRRVNSQAHFEDAGRSRLDVGAEDPGTREPSAEFDIHSILPTQHNHNLAGGQRRELGEIGHVDCESPTFSGDKHRILHEQFRALRPVGDSDRGAIPFGPPIVRSVIISRVIARSTSR